MEAYIVVKNSYPSPPPIISLCLNYKGLHHAENSDEIRVNIIIYFHNLLIKCKLSY